MRPTPRNSELSDKSFGLLKDKQARPADTARSILPSQFKPGHSLTFVGLYLFTAVVYFRPYELFDALSWTSSAALSLAIFTLLVYALTQISLDGNLTIRTREIDLALLLLLMAALSIPMALDRTLSINATFEFAKVILIFVVISNTVRTEKRLRSLLWLVLVASCVISGFAVDDYRAGRMTLQGLRIQGVIGGIFSNPNDLALQLVMMSPIAVGLLFSSRSRAGRMIYLFIIALFVLGIVATFSRGGFIGLVGVVAVFIWRSLSRNRLAILTGGLFLTIGFIVLVPNAYRDRISNTNDASAMARQDELKRSLYLITRHPILGVGMNNFILYSNQDHATHNAYTQVGSELGVVAMIMYILILVATLKRIRTIQREFQEIKDSCGRWFAIGLEASLIGYMISSFFLSVAYLWYVYYLVGYAISFDRITEEKRNSISEASIRAHG